MGARVAARKEFQNDQRCWLQRDLVAMGAGAKARKQVAARSTVVHIPVGGWLSGKMKIQRAIKRSENGSAVLVILILLFLIVAFSMANSRALSNLKKEMQILETRQMKRLQDGTNHVSVEQRK